MATNHLRQIFAEEIKYCSYILATVAKCVTDYENEAFCFPNVVRAVVKTLRGFPRGHLSY